MAVCVLCSSTYVYANITALPSRNVEGFQLEILHNVYFYIEFLDFKFKKSGSSFVSVDLPASF